MNLAPCSIELQVVKECDATGGDISIAAKCKKKSLTMVKDFVGAKKHQRTIHFMICLNEGFLPYDKIPVR